MRCLLASLQSFSKCSNSTAGNLKVGIAKLLLERGRRLTIAATWDSGCGSVGGAVTSDTRDPRFKPRHRESFIYQIIYQLFHRKGGNKEKEAGNGPS